MSIEVGQRIFAKEFLSLEIDSGMLCLIATRYTNTSLPSLCCAATFPSEGTIFYDMEGTATIKVIKTANLHQEQRLLQNSLNDHGKGWLL